MDDQPKKKPMLKLAGHSIQSDEEVQNAYKGIEIVRIYLNDHGYEVLVEAQFMEYVSSKEEMAEHIRQAVLEALKRSLYQNKIN